MPSRRVRAASIGAACLAVAVLSGCSASRGTYESAVLSAQRGELGLARARLAEQLESGKRTYRVRELSAMNTLWLVDGLPAPATRYADEAFAALRRQGENQGLPVDTWAGDLWKGEPFEQAMTFAYVAMQKGAIGEWDNARAAAGESLFRLKDFRDSQERDKTGTLSKAELTDRAARKPGAASGSSGVEDWLDKGYVLDDTDFALGHTLAGIANTALGRADEASDQFRRAVEVRPSLRPIAEAFMSGKADVALIIDYGPGPRKEAFGPDEALTRFVPRLSSDAGTMRIAGDPTPYDWSTDVNVMAADHRWQQLDDVRRARSIAGDWATAAGAVAIGAGVIGDSDEAVIAGAAVLVLGQILKAAARADDSFDEFLPQRTYVLPLTRAQAEQGLELTGPRGEILRLPPTTIPDQPRLALQYLRFPQGGGDWNAPVLYANDAYADEVPGDDLPYILGGRCVRAPSAESLAYYQSKGRLKDVTLSELQNLYRAEGIVLEEAEMAPMPGDNDRRRLAHILEGGRNLATPRPWSFGYFRLFCRNARAYEPRSAELNEFKARHGLP